MKTYRSYIKVIWEAYLNILVKGQGRLKSSLGQGQLMIKVKV